MCFIFCTQMCVVNLCGGLVRRSSTRVQHITRGEYLGCRRRHDIVLCYIGNSVKL